MKDYLTHPNLQSRQGWPFLSFHRKQPYWLYLVVSSILFQVRVAIEKRIKWGEESDIQGRKNFKLHRPIHFSTLSADCLLSQAHGRGIPQSLNERFNSEQKGYSTLLWKQKGEMWNRYKLPAKGGRFSGNCVWFWNRFHHLEGGWGVDWGGVMMGYDLLDYR